MEARAQGFGPRDTLPLVVEHDSWRAALSDRRRLVRYAVAVLIAWVVFYVVNVHACSLYSLSFADGGRALVCRAFNAAWIPFGVIVELFLPAVGHHYGTIHLLLRALLAAASLVGLVFFVATGRSIARNRGRAAMKGSSSSVSRREALGRITDVAFLGFAGAVGGWTLWISPDRLCLRRYDLSIRNLPRALDGLRIAHLTDTHYGPYIGASQIRAAMELANEQSPHLTVLTGDYVHRRPETVEPGIGLFAELRAEHGVVAVLGNHDHWEGAGACRDVFRRIGIPLVDNDRLFLTPEGLSDVEIPGESLAICGVGDLWEGEPDPRAATRGVSPDCPRLLLSHNPDVAEHLPPRFSDIEFDLQISGHTHGGQVSLPKIGAPMVPSEFGAKYEGGLVQGPGWPVVVSRAVGMSIVPIRFLVPPEVGLIVLRRA